MSQINVMCLSRYSKQSEKLFNLLTESQLEKEFKFLFLDRQDVREYAEQFITFVPALVRINVINKQIEKIEGEAVFVEIENLIDRRNLMRTAELSRTEKVTREEVANLIRESESVSQSKIQSHPETVFEIAKRLQREHDAASAQNN